MPKQRTRNPADKTSEPLTPEQEAEREAAKAAKFEELATARMTAWIKRTRQLVNLADRTNYRYTDEQRDKLLATVKEEVAKLVKAYETGSTTQSGFSF